MRIAMLFLFTFWIISAEAAVNLPPEIAKIKGSLGQMYPVSLELDGTNFPQGEWRSLYLKRFTHTFNEEKTLSSLSAILEEVRNIYQHHIYALPYVRNSDLLKAWNDFQGVKLELIEGDGAFYNFSSGSLTFGRAMATGTPSRALRAFVLAHELKHVALSTIPSGLNEAMKETGIAFLDHSKIDGGTRSKRGQLFGLLVGVQSHGISGAVRSGQALLKEGPIEPVVADAARIYELLGVNVRKAYENYQRAQEPIKEQLKSFKLSPEQDEDLKPNFKKPNEIGSSQGSGTEAYAALETLVRNTANEDILKEIRDILFKYGGLIDQREEFAADFLATKVVVEYIRRNYVGKEQQRMAALSVLYYYPNDFKTEMQRDVMSLLGSKLPWDRRIDIVLANKDFQDLLLMQ